MSTTQFSRGSEWRKWDLHVHTPMSYQQHYSNWDSYISQLKIKAVEHDIEVMGVNDYFSVSGYEKLLEECPESSRNSSPYVNISNGKRLYIFPVVELRLENFTGGEESINIHVLFSPDILPSTIRSSFLENLDIQYQRHTLKCKEDDLIRIGYAEEHNGSFDANINISNLSQDDKKRLRDKALRIITFSSSVFNDGIEKFKHLLEDSGIMNNKYLVLVANKGHGGLSELRFQNDQGELSRSGNIRQNILCLADIAFSNSAEDAEFLIGKREDTSKEEVRSRFRSCKPCVWGSDARSEESLFHPSDGNTSDYTWIKADPTFEGLMQIVYEPEPGERVSIGPTSPDNKDDYKVIKNIKFIGSDDFPEIIEFNKNLCSIIGSRSSGKSALLSYIAHAVDPVQTEELKPTGPGEGEEYRWGKVNMRYEVTWENGKSNNDNRGRVVYVPQNHLFKESQNADAVKERIAPVLFKTYPDFKAKYHQVLQDVNLLNENISSNIDQWFSISNEIDIVHQELKQLGDREAINQLKLSTQGNIEKVREKNNLTEEDVESYQKVVTEIDVLQARASVLDAELIFLHRITSESPYFTSLVIRPTPSQESLPGSLQKTIDVYLDGIKEGILQKANDEALSYKASITQESSDIKQSITQKNQDNSDLINRYKEDLVLKDLVNKVSELNKTILDIDDKKQKITKLSQQLTACEVAIVSNMSERERSLGLLGTEISSIEQGDQRGIKFGIECAFSDQVQSLCKKINVKYNTDFVEGGHLKFEDIRLHPIGFLKAIHSGNQKVISGEEKVDVVDLALTLTEKVLFTAEMEGDKIGGFQESTMTPGKRALFSLKLILSESDDSWPLLIDQPEDDLDSRSIYHEIVPFIKEKKKERQIIMVSHNANLVIGSDSEQIIVANRNGSDRSNADGRQFNYLSGSMENSRKKDLSCADTLESQGVCEHACEILDGGSLAFEQRMSKYNLLAKSIR